MPLRKKIGVVSTRASYEGCESLVAHSWLVVKDEGAITLSASRPELSFVFVRAARTLHSELLSRRPASCVHVRLSMGWFSCVGPVSESG